MLKRPFLSIVIPVYGCERCLKVLHKRISAVCKKECITYEIIFIDDHSADGGWRVIKGLQRKDSGHVSGIRLKINAGQHRAIGRGVLAARGMSIVVMDCDLQDRPEELTRLITAYKKYPKLVVAKRLYRRYSAQKMIAVKVFHILFSLITGRNSDPDYGNFSIVSRMYIPELRNNPFFGVSYVQALISLSVPFVVVGVNHGNRYAGVSTYTIPGLFIYAFRCFFMEVFGKSRWKELKPEISERLGI